MKGDTSETDSRDVEGVMLVSDASVAETAEICERFEKRGIRFAVRQTYVDNAFHMAGGSCYNGSFGNGTRMCILVHPDDLGEAKKILRE